MFCLLAKDEELLPVSNLTASNLRRPTPSWKVLKNESAHFEFIFKKDKNAHHRHLLLFCLSESTIHNYNFRLQLELKANTLTAR